ncbi:MAG: hypothetical protein ABR583_05615 [Gaiellaceae bacterium]
MRSARSPWPLVALAAALVIAGAAAVVVTQRGDGKPGTGTGSTAAGSLPSTPDYHSLLVAPKDPKSLLLGTHQGLHRSADGGRTWSFEGLSGQDAMNLAQPSTKVLWAAGHDVLAKSTDGGATWQDVRPAGLPGLDVHGFAVHPRNQATLYAAMAGRGLYRSVDGGRSFSLLSSVVGPAVMALAVLPGERILAGDMQRGLLVGRAGKPWRRVLAEPVIGLAVSRARSGLVLASAAGAFRSTDGAETWKQTLELAEGAGPVAWAPSEPDVAYLVGLDQVLYRTTDAGETWHPVS